ncbi:hypothetical protein ACTFIZ_004192 [Dictyostelium cf. discoideum]
MALPDHCKQVNQSEDSPFDLNVSIYSINANHKYWIGPTLHIHSMIQITMIYSKNQVISLNQQIVSITLTNSGNGETSTDDLLEVTLNSIRLASWLDKNNNVQTTATATTDSNSNYIFDILLAGDYFFVATSIDSTFTEPQPIDRTDVNLGLVSTIVMCQYVWIDKNNNGKEESDEPSLGVQVIITSSNGTSAIINDTESMAAYHSGGSFALEPMKLWFQEKCYVLMLDLVKMMFNWFI